MLQEFEVQCDVTFSGSFYVNAETEEEARRIVMSKSPVPSDIRNFCHFSTDILEVEAIGEASED